MSESIGNYIGCDYNCIDCPFMDNDFTSGGCRATPEKYRDYKLKKKLEKIIKIHPTTP